MKNAEMPRKTCMKNKQWQEFGVTRVFFPMPGWVLLLAWMSVICPKVMRFWFHWMGANQTPEVGPFCTLSYWRNLCCHPWMGVHRVGVRVAYIHPRPFPTLGIRIKSQHPTPAVHVVGWEMIRTGHWRRGVKSSNRGRKVTEHPLIVCKKQWGWSETLSQSSW